MDHFVLDTDIVTLLLHGDKTISERAANHDPEFLSVTIISVEEILTGWYAQIRRVKKDEKVIRAYQSLQEAVEFLGRIRILPFDVKANTRFRTLRKSKIRVGVNDLKIAAIAQQHDAVLVTRNLRDFRKISDLKLEEWQ